MFVSYQRSLGDWLGAHFPSNGALRIRAVGTEIPRLNPGGQVVAESWHGFRDLVDGVLDAFGDGRSRAFSLRSCPAVPSAEANRHSQLIGNAVHLLPSPF